MTRFRFFFALFLFVCASILAAAGLPVDRAPETADPPASLRWAGDAWNMEESLSLASAPSAAGNEVEVWQLLTEFPEPLSTIELTLQPQKEVVRLAVEVASTDFDLLIVVNGRRLLFEDPTGNALARAWLSEDFSEVTIALDLQAGSLRVNGDALSTSRYFAASRVGQRLILKNLGETLVEGLELRCVPLSEHVQVANENSHRLPQRQAPRSASPDAVHPVSAPDSLPPPHPFVAMDAHRRMMVTPYLAKEETGGSLHRRPGIVPRWVLQPVRTNGNSE